MELTERLSQFSGDAEAIRGTLTLPPTSEEGSGG